VYRVKTLREKSLVFNFKPRMNVQNETKEFKSMHNKIPETSVAESFGNSIMKLVNAVYETSEFVSFGY